MPVPREHRAPPSSLMVPLHCPVPECDSAQASLAVASKSIATFCCPKCHFMWSAEIRQLPDTVQELMVRSAS
jgi:hypothetical protein